MASATQGLLQSVACGVAKIAVTTSQVGNEQWEGPACTRNGAITPESRSASTTPTKRSPNMKKRFGRFSSKSKYHDQLAAPLSSDLPSPKGSRKHEHGMQRSRSHQTIFHHRTTIERSISLDDVLSANGTTSDPPSPRDARRSKHHIRRHHSHNPRHHHGSDPDVTEHQHNIKEGLVHFFQKRRDHSYYSLYYPKNSEALLERLNYPLVDLTVRNDEGDAPIHAVVRHKRGKRLDLLTTLLANSDADIDLPEGDGCTALHLAVMEGDELLVKALLSFGADINARNNSNQTPLDVAIQEKRMELVDLLVSAGGSIAAAKKNFRMLPRLLSFTDSSTPKVFELSESDRDSETDSIDGGTDSPDYESLGKVSKHRSCRDVKLGDIDKGDGQCNLYERIQHFINTRIEFSGSFSANTDEAIAITFQQRELHKYKKTEQRPGTYEIRGGSRILCLDGGGMRGLIHLEVLRQLEEQTGRRVTEMFDWIVGTSTGAIIALGLVYAKKTLTELRQLYFQLKEQIFAHDRYGFAYNTAALEEILKEAFGTEMKMSDVTFPRAIVTAVNKETTVLEMHLFNNCFNDQFSTQPVWKVARYASASPLFFTEFENYVDGGVLANNPCEYALSAISNHYRGLEEKLDIGLVVSIGTGIYPAEKLGNVDAQEFFFFGKHWFNTKDTLKDRAKNLITLLATALGDSESIAMTSRSRLWDQGVPFYRFNPHLNEEISPAETNLEKLFNLIIQTRLQTEGPDMKELVQLFHLVAEMSRKMQARKYCEARAEELYRTF